MRKVTIHNYQAGVRKPDGTVQRCDIPIEYYEPTNKLEEIVGELLGLILFAFNPYTITITLLVFLIMYYGNIR